MFRAAGVVVAFGHTDADYSCMAGALSAAAGAALVTHLGNAMPPLLHRAAGPVAAALVAAAAGEASVELIADGVHVDAGFTRLVFAAAPGRVVLVTDAMAAAGMPDGSYALGPLRVTVSGGVARLAAAGDAGPGGPARSRAGPAGCSRSSRPRTRRECRWPSRRGPRARRPPGCSGCPPRAARSPPGWPPTWSSPTRTWPSGGSCGPGGG